MPYRLALLTLAASVSMSQCAWAEPDRDAIAKTIVMGAAYLRCPKGTVSERSMALGALLIEKETGAPADQALQVFMSAAQKMAATIESEQQLASICKTFVDKLP